MNGIAPGSSESSRTAVMADSFVHPKAIPFNPFILARKELKDELTGMEGLKGIKEEKKMLGPAYAH